MLRVVLPLASCRLLRCCLRSWDGSGGTAVNSAAATVAALPLLQARCFVVFRAFFVRRVDAHSHFPPQFRRRRLQKLVYLVRKHTKIMMGRSFIFISFEGRFRFTHVANTPFFPFFPTAAVPGYLRLFFESNNIERKVIDLVPIVMGRSSP